MTEPFDVKSALERRFEEAVRALAALAAASDMALPKAHAELARVRNAIDAVESTCVLVAVWKGTKDHELACMRVRELRVAIARLLERWFPTLSDGIRLAQPDGEADPVMIVGAADIERADLSGSILRRSVLRSFYAARACLDRIDAVRARWRDCRFVESSLVAAQFDGSGMYVCDFSRANLARTRWCGASVERCCFAGAVLFEADLRDTIFAECDFRGADLGSEGAAPITSGAFFYRCDLRETGWGRRDLSGVRFIECKMFGVHGRPQLGDVVIADPDTTRAGDGTHSDPQQIYGAWCS